MRGPIPAIAAALLSGTAAAGDPAPAWVEQARAGAAGLGGELKQALIGAMEQGGPVAAIDVCSHQAPAIARQVSSPNMDVGRTALKARNPGNAPDAWEQRVMVDFQQRLAAGEAPANIEVFTLRNDGEQRWGHWMKAIPTEGLCTACHGTDLAPEVAEAIDAAYPDDQATGFRPGDLRGAFSVRIDIAENQ